MLLLLPEFIEPVCETPCEYENKAFRCGGGETGVVVSVGSEMLRWNSGIREMSQFKITAGEVDLSGKTET